jgi:hypothetical protein
MNVRKAINSRSVMFAVLCLIFVVTIPLLMNSGCCTTEGLAPVEVREYEGTDLSSINDFRENSIGGPQYLDIEDYTLTITGWSVTILWDGVLVKDLLAEAGPLGNAKVAIFHAYDGYTTSLPIGYILDNDILMAYKMNDVVLPPARGFPFQLVAESKWGYKWIKWITEIELSADTSYRGYWESRGYSNSADLDQGFFGG